MGRQIPRRRLKGFGPQRVKPLDDGRLHLLQSKFLQLLSSKGEPANDIGVFVDGHGFAYINRPFKSFCFQSPISSAHTFMNREVHTGKRKRELTAADEAVVLGPTQLVQPEEEKEPNRPMKRARPMEWWEELPGINKPISAVMLIDLLREWRMRFPDSQDSSRPTEMVIALLERNPTFRPFQPTEQQRPYTEQANGVMPLVTDLLHDCPQVFVWMSENNRGKRFCFPAAWRGGWYHYPELGHFVAKHTRGGLKPMWRNVMRAWIRLRHPDEERHVLATDLGWACFYLDLDPRTVRGELVARGWTDAPDITIPIPEDNDYDSAQVHRCYVHCKDLFVYLLSTRQMRWPRPFAELVRDHLCERVVAVRQGEPYSTASPSRDARMLETMVQNSGLVSLTLSDLHRAIHPPTSHANPWTLEQLTTRVFGRATPVLRADLLARVAGTSLDLVIRFLQPSHDDTQWLDRKLGPVHDATHRETAMVESACAQPIFHDASQVDANRLAWTWVKDKTRGQAPWRALLGLFMKRLAIVTSPRGHREWVRVILRLPEKEEPEGGMGGVESFSSEAKCCMYMAAFLLGSTELSFPGSRTDWARLSNHAGVGDNSSAEDKSLEEKEEKQSSNCVVASRRYTLTMEDRLQLAMPILSRLSVGALRGVLKLHHRLKCELTTLSKTAFELYPSIRSTLVDSEQVQFPQELGDLVFQFCL